MSVEVPLSPAATSLNDSSHSKKRVLERAAQLLGQHDPEIAESIFERLLERERLGSTGMVDGVALPHARMADIENPRGAFIRLAQPVDFDSQDGAPVDLVFALIVPEEATQEHLQMLAQLARFFHNPDTRQAVRKAAAAEEINRLLDGSVADAT